MRATAVLQTAAFMVSVAGPAFAQNSGASHHDREPSEFERRSAFSISFAQTRPWDDLAQNIGFGYGVQGTYHFRLDQAGIWGIRADLGISDYGENTQHVPFIESGRVALKVKTSNYIIPMSIGPQLMWPTGSVRPYVNAGVGGQAFYTESHLEGGDETDSFASTTNQSDFTAAWTMGGGVYMPIAAGHAKVQLDLGVQYYGGGTARYLNKRSIADLPGGQVQITPLQSNTHLMLVRLGARIGY